MSFKKKIMQVKKNIFREPFIMLKNDLKTVTLKQFISVKIIHMLKSTMIIVKVKEEMS